MEQNPILHSALSLDSDIPLYAQLVGIIKRNISTGVLAVGALLPSEAELCRCLNIPVSAAIAIGDSENDRSMLRDAGLPLAMGNAIDDVKAASEYIMPDCDHDGVAEAIERFLLAQR